MGATILTTGTAILMAGAGGLLPTLVWLWFWLSEDRCQPEPRVRIMLTFLAGILSVVLVLPVEDIFAQFAPQIQSFLAVILPSALYSVAVVVPAGSTIPVFVFVLWASSEELLKLGAASPFGLISRAYDEPIDAVVYMTTAALGFAAAENGLYLFTGGHGAAIQSLLTGDLRFVGATLLHVLSSATIGLVMAFFYSYPRVVRVLALLCGVILAITLHTLFNFFILLEGGARVLYVFAPIWLGVVVVLALLERVKNPRRDYC
jgi:RsiW-degrading membrane proteinase PrsW (M82 family)